MNIKALLTEKFQLAMAAAGLPEDANPAVNTSANPQFGDYQANGIMGQAKKLKINPRELAQKVMDNLKLGDMAEKVEIAGPGFINIHLNNAWIAQQISAIASDDKLNVTLREPKTVVVDYSAPNLAKEMHVGHLRSTIIGDAVVRVLEFLGDRVIRQNHMGDWGTQFGMLLAHFQDQLAENSVKETALSDLEEFYRAAKKRYDDEAGFADRARAKVVELQGGDEACMQLWQQFIDVSVQHSEEVYERLNVTLKRGDIAGESQYNPMLAGVVETLLDKAIAVEDDGAIVAFIQELADKKGNPSPFIIQKSGGGFLYSTTDLAAMKYRSYELGADRIIIFTDARQSLHFKQAEIVGRKAEFIKPDTTYEHCPFGMMLGNDGKPFKTRTGGTVKLAELLDEAVERAEKLMAEKNPDMDETTCKAIARTVGIGAVKYADLSKNRNSDYQFSWDSMLSFEGATAPYLQYACTRLHSIFRKAELAPEQCAGTVIVAETKEKELATKLLQFEDALLSVANEALPNVLCLYLYELAGTFMSFYEACPILKDGVADAVKASRLHLARATLQTLETGLALLGIDTPEQM